MFELKRLVSHRFRKFNPGACRKDPDLAQVMLTFLETHVTFHPLEKEFQQLKQLYMASVKLEPSRWITVRPRVLKLAVSHRVQPRSESGGSNEGDGNTDEKKGKEKERVEDISTDIRQVAFDLSSIRYESPWHCSKGLGSSFCSVPRSLQGRWH